ncbi:cation:proton antiporter [Loigolactobacillus backii]|uniref:Sodium:proton antiporter n=1 Tax=Loigolactobacillus backii TaxID=375175 RepID=A0A192GZU0_9LACO|nr:cation:proton antiporter [Loigolactobacillus backii]ANK60814.1 sodium:proton antiporter [Loigolactobacillus backii]ANK61615.1 sodium:proton antiporter [Loigolactobacillus backii]ANK65768.1 sodium:proton antiporter [Loigolactobacillus backii]ANK68244.1 sodium:proton antiporter [Loigolactobacillus backii]ANK69185.1 sodium:proton antiporter [Loigolactobacillus backii]
MAFLGTLCLILVTTALAGHFSARIGIPAVIGQLLVGIIVGPAVLNWVQPNAFVHDFSEIGVIILMFIAGLESNLELLKRYLRPSVIVATAGVILPVGLIYLTSLWFKLSQVESLFLGIIFAATSVSISVEVLKEMKALDSKEGTTILGAAVVDDVLAVVILSVMVSLVGSQLSTSNAAPTPIGISLLEQVLYFVGIYIVVRWLAPYLLRIGEQLLVPVSVTITSMVLCLSMAYLADLVGLSAVVGSFFAGIAVGQTSYRKVVDQSIEPIGYAIFIPVFFVSIGLNMTFSSLGKDIWFLLALTVVGVFTKLVGAGFGAYISGFSLNSSYMIGAGMISRGEMALIIAQIGFQAKLLSADRYSAVIGAIIATTLIAPFLLRHAISKIRKA